MTISFRGGVSVVIIAFRLQSEFGPKKQVKKETENNEVLIAFRLQSEFGPIEITLEKSDLVYKGLNRLSASVRIWTAKLPLFKYEIVALES